MRYVSSIRRPIQVVLSQYHVRLRYLHHLLRAEADGHCLRQTGSHRREKGRSKGDIAEHIVHRRETKLSTTIGEAETPSRPGFPTHVCGFNVVVPCRRHIKSEPLPESIDYAEVLRSAPLSGRRTSAVFAWGAKISPQQDRSISRGRNTLTLTNALSRETAAPYHFNQKTEGHTHDPPYFRLCVRADLLAKPSWMGALSCRRCTLPNSPV